MSGGLCLSAGIACNSLPAETKVPEPKTAEEVQHELREAEARGVLKYEAAIEEYDYVAGRSVLREMDSLLKRWSPSFEKECEPFRERLEERKLRMVAKEAQETVYRTMKNVNRLRASAQFRSALVLAKSQLVDVIDSELQAVLEQLIRTIEGELSAYVAGSKPVPGWSTAGVDVQDRQVPTLPGYAASPEVAGLEFVRVKGGKYRVGTPWECDGRDPELDIDPMDITISEFFISTTEVTQEAFAKVIPDKIWGKYVGPQIPAHSLTIDEARQYCKELSRHDPKFTFSLPSEFEWEIACRSGLDPKAGPFIADAEKDAARLRDPHRAAQALKKYAHFDMSSSWPVQVANKLPNPWGLYDMHGNVAEWCEKHAGLGELYEHTISRYPIRGGSVFSNHLRCRAGSRVFERLAEASATIGFRLIARPAPVTGSEEGRR